MTIKLDGWTRWAIFAIITLVALGGYLVTVRSNTMRIGNAEIKAEVMDKEFRTAITTLQTDVEWIKSGIGRIETAVAAKK